MTDFAASTVTMHVPVPLHPAPLHPVKVDPAAAVAVRVTTVSSAKLASHVTPQSMPAGDELTLPAPVPAGVTVSACWSKPNVAVT